VRELRARILHDVLAPGDPLPSERRLAEEYGVNRGAVREALKRLAQAGLVRIQHGDITRVADYRSSTAMDVLLDRCFGDDGEQVSSSFIDFVEARQLLYPEIARLAARLGGPDLADRLDPLAREMETADRDAGVRTWTSFFTELVDATDNPFVRVFDNVCAEIVRRLRVDLSSAQRDLAAANLRAIAVAVRSRDEEAAAAAMRRELTRSNRASSVPAAAEPKKVDVPIPAPQGTLQEDTPGSASEQVFRQLRRKISRGELAVGAALPGERALAEEFQVNRGAIREALQRLSQCRLVAIRHGDATRVLDYRNAVSFDVLPDVLFRDDGSPNPEVAARGFEVLSWIYPDVARRAAARGGPETARRFEAIVSEVEAAGTAQPAAVEARLLLCRTLFATAENLVYRFFHNNSEEFARRVPWNLSARVVERELAQFRALTKAIAERDGETAARLFGEWFQGQSDAYVRHMERLES
jgi:DNA-binding FadR family transcriptional regulator